MCEGERSRSGGDESESEEETRDPIDEEEGKGDKMSEYEKKRLTRIAENRARLEALGISKAAKALVPPPSIIRKPNSGEKEEEDDDYRPEDAEDEIDESEYEEDEEFVEESSSVSRKRKNKTTSPPKRKKKHLCRSDSLGEDDDDDLNKAIALSLQDSVAVAGGSHRNNQKSGTPKKNKSDLIMSKMQMTADELILYFFQFDKAGKGFITLRDVATMATVHDFTWSDEELQDMIRCFDFDKDGKLSLDEFKKVVTRCRMLNES